MKRKRRQVPRDTIHKKLVKETLEKKKVIVVHRWDGTPNSDWYPWLQQESQQRGIVVVVPALPNPKTPTIEEHVPFLKKTIGTLTNETILVGHSIGCQTILRYLERCSDDEQAGGIVLVAPWLLVTGLATAEERTIAEPWLTTPIDFEKVRSHTSKVIAFFSDNDPFVPAENQQLFQNALNAEVNIVHAAGHMTEDDGWTTAPAVLESVLQLTNT